MAQSDILAVVTTVTRSVSGANAALSASVAGVANQRHMVSGFTISFSGGPDTGVTVTVTSGATVLDEFEIPATAADDQQPIHVEFYKAIRGGTGEAITLACDAAGVGNTITGVLRTYRVAD